MFKQSFKIFKPKVLKAQVLEDETKLYSKNFVIPIAYLKSCLKMSVLTNFEQLCFFLSFAADFIRT